MVATVAALDLLALAASAVPSLNPPTPIYAIIRSDSFLPLTIPSSWVEFSPRYESAVSDYPVELGAYAVYNKVRRPREITVTMVKTGSDLARAAWLAAIDLTEKTKPTQLYTLIAPQGIYIGYTIVGMSNETRSERGSNMLYLTIRFTEVPQIPSSAGTYSNTKQAKSGVLDQLGQLYTNVTTAAQNTLIEAKNFILG
jgi:hypothetical protein